jgi:hypothetical protein
MKRSTRSWKPPHDQSEEEFDAWKVCPPLTLAEAKTVDDAFVLLRGEYGATTYLIARVACLGCSHERLEALLEILDGAGWGDIRVAEIEFAPEAVAVQQVKTHHVRLAPAQAWLHQGLLSLTSIVRDYAAWS